MRTQITNEDLELSVLDNDAAETPIAAQGVASGLSEPRDTIEEVIEPYLIQLGLLARTARGRCLNVRAWTHLVLAPPTTAGQAGLFDG